MLLVYILFIPIAIPAMAEKGYESIKSSIVQNLGEGMSVKADLFPEQDVLDAYSVYILFYTWKNEVVLWGENSRGELEGTLWESDLCIPLFGGYCGSWQDLSASLENGYSLKIILQVEDDGELLLIDDAEKANIMYQAIMNQ